MGRRRGRSQARRPRIFHDASTATIEARPCIGVRRLTFKCQRGAEEGAQYRFPLSLRHSREISASEEQQLKQKPARTMERLAVRAVASLSLLQHPPSSHALTHPLSLLPPLSQLRLHAPSHNNAICTPPFASSCHFTHYNVTKESLSLHARF